jgi:L-lactate utilization protein LutB
MACAGCGRCAAVCHGDIGMPSVVEMVRRAVTEAEKANIENPKVEDSAKVAVQKEVQKHEFVSH